MKITVSDYQSIKSGLENVIKPFGFTALLAYEKELFNSQKTTDIEAELAWDLFWSIGEHMQKLILKNIRAYGCRSNHLETALRKAMKEIWIKMEVEQYELNVGLRAKIRHLNTNIDRKVA